MRIEVDFDSCICSGMCTTIAPALFALSDAGELVVLHEDDLASDQQASAEDAAACCPAEAIVLATPPADDSR